MSDAVAAKRARPTSSLLNCKRLSAKAAQQYDGNALQTLVDIMNDDTATAAARVRCAELILDRAHGKPAFLQDPNRDPDFVPLAERLKWYARPDAVDAAEGTPCKSCRRRKEHYRPRPTRLLRGDAGCSQDRRRGDASPRCFRIREKKCPAPLHRGSVLHVEKVGNGLVEALGPQMRAGFRVDELDVDAQPVARALNAALQYIPHVQLTSDLLQVDMFALVGEGGVGRGDPHRSGCAGFPVHRCYAIRAGISCQ